MTSVSPFRAVVGTELRLRVRNPSFTLLVAVVVSVCALLVPAPTASYTTVMVNGQRLAMSADASLTAAGVVLSILLLLLFALAFDVGHVRDAEHGLDQLHLTSPVRADVLAAGRLFTNIAVVLGVIVFSLLVISSTIYARALGTPSSSAIVVFLLIVGPVGIAAVALGALLDRYLGRWTGRRTLAAFTVWFAAMLASATGGQDLFGVSYLRRVIVAGGHPASLAVGAVSTRGLASIPWTSTPLTPDLIWSRVMVTAVLGAVIAMLSVAIRFRIGTAHAVGATRDGRWVTTDLEPEAPSHALPRRRASGGRANIPLTMYIVVRRWLAGSRLATALMLLTLALAIRRGDASSATFAAALVIPAVVVSRTSRREVRVASTLESTTSALVRPTATLTYCWVLAVLALLPAVPALVRTNLLQATTAVFGMLAATMWLTWAHRCAQRPVLGTATFAALWYLSVFNHPPASFDVFGLWGANVRALLGSLVAAGVTLVLVVRHDRAWRTRPFAASGGSWRRP